MQEKSIYGEQRPAMEQCLADLLLKLEEFRAQIRREQGMDPVEHMPARIKSEESMIGKCIRKGLPVTEESALTKIHDGIGVRPVCGFLNDVYAMRDKICADPEITVIEEKDYIRSVKPNGYRSLHLIVRELKRCADELASTDVTMQTIRDMIVAAPEAE